MVSDIYLKFVLPGITFGFAAGAQPGPFTVYLISRTLQTGWKKTFPAIFAPVISDIPVAVICLVLLESLPEGFLKYIQVAGGLFILYLAARAALSWEKGSSGTPVRTNSGSRTFFDATLVNVLNPNAYLGWSLVMGPLVLGSWEAAPTATFATLGGFYLTMFSVTTVIIIIFGMARNRGPRMQHALIGLSALFLAAMGVYQVVSGVKAF